MRGTSLTNKAVRLRLLNICKSVSLAYCSHLDRHAAHQVKHPLHTDIHLNFFKICVHKDISRTSIAHLAQDSVSQKWMHTNVVERDFRHL